MSASRDIIGSPEIQPMLQRRSDKGTRLNNAMIDNNWRLLVVDVGRLQRVIVPCLLESMEFVVDVSRRRLSRQRYDAVMPDLRWRMLHVLRDRGSDTLVELNLGNGGGEPLCPTLPRPSRTSPGGGSGRVNTAPAAGVQAEERGTERGPVPHAPFHTRYESDPPGALGASVAMWPRYVCSRGHSHGPPRIISRLDG
jgi:hypothetical protein